MSETAGGNDAQAGADERPSVLVLTPLKNAAGHLDRYAELIEALTWPRQRLALGLLESDSTDGTFEKAMALRPRLERAASRVEIATHDFGLNLPAGVPRWAPAYQLARRAVLARSRNQLLFRALRDEEWVLWIDVDVIDYPPDIIERLLSFKRDILHPHCIKGYGGPTFDLNAWVDRGAKTMNELRGAAAPVRLDSVGGTMLLVRADLHRDGLIFPAFRYGLASERIRPVHPIWGRGEIETEGFGAMAADMGVQCWGLPDLIIVHAAE
jgi:peptide chain release factor subunit 1